MGFAGRLFVISVRPFDSATLPGSQDPYLLHLLLVLSPHGRVLDLHEARRQHRLHLLHMLDAKLCSDLLQLLIYSLQFIILRLQLFFLLRVFLQQFLVEFHVLFF